MNSVSKTERYRELRKITELRNNPLHICVLSLLAHKSCKVLDPQLPLMQVASGDTPVLVVTSPPFIKPFSFIP
jgi:hypothetical protein